MLRDYSATSDMILSAASVFQEHGYDAATLSQLAQAASITVPELEAHYPHKEFLALGLYRVLASESLTDVGDLPRGTLAHRYRYVLQRKIQQLAPHEDALSALFATAMRRNGCLQAADIAPGKTDPMYQVFAKLVADADDAPQAEAEAQDAALLLYGVYHYMVIFWLYDRTEGKRATEMLMTIASEFLKVSRPMLMMPFLGKSISKVGRVMMLIFGGARIVD